MALQDVKVDFQVTGWVSETPPKSSIKKALLSHLDSSSKSLLDIANSLYSKEENRAIFLLNYYKPKYERVTSNTREVKSRGYEVDEDNSSTFVGLTLNGKKWLYVIRGTEFLTDKGHVIVGGIPDQFKFKESHYSQGPKLEEVLDWAKNREALIIPSHPLTSFNFLERQALRWVKDPSGTNIGMTEETIRKYKDYFDAIERFSLSISPEQSLRIYRLAKSLGIPTVTDSDGTVETALSSYNIFTNVNFSSPKLMRESLRNGLNKRKGNSYKSKASMTERQLSEKTAHVLINKMHFRSNY